MNKLLILCLLFAFLSLSFAAQELAHKDHHHKHGGHHHHHHHHKHHHGKHHHKHPSVKHHGVTKCITKCVNKHHQHSFVKCWAHVHPGAIVKNCIQKKKQSCHKKCWATKRCFTVFKTKDCGHCKHCTVPVVKCVRGHKCAKECLWVHFRDCFFKKLPDFLVKKCSKIFVDKKFKECVTGCIHIVKTKKCWDKCVKHRIDKEHSKCERVLARKGKKFKRCSIKDIGKICHKQCKHFPAICKNVCKDKSCGHSKCHCCRIKCTKRPDVCHKWCIEKKI